jgi:predicted DNA-binding transcriptional regulator
MQHISSKQDRSIERAVREILKSRARSRIYTYLLRKNGARSEEIIKGTRLHPSTVRETLSQMYDQKLIYRKKLKNDHIGKNPYIYHPIPPFELIKKYTTEIEDRLNKIAILGIPTSERRNHRPLKIKILEAEEEP